ncbi:hypothetical protein APHAL10511_003761 [Amanita phalloides]|nr:hypothetical protein APHAL10511_003761 [Amanita phalloides]
MQAPVSVFDRCFLEMDPLFSVFDTLCYDVSHRGSRHDKFKSVIQQLKTQGWAKAVQRWRYLAFPRSKNKKPVIDDRNWRIFVRFQWRLKHSRQQADIYLSNLRSGRSPTRLPSLSEDRRPLAYISFKRRRQPGTHRGTGIQAIKNPVARRKKRNTKAKVDAKPESMAVDPSTSLGDRYTNNHYWQINRSDESYADATPSHQEQLAIVDPISIDSQPYPLIFVQENDPEDREASFNHWNDVGYRQEMLVNIPTATNIKSPPLNSMMGLVPQPISSLSVSVYNGGLPISDAAHNMTAVHLPTTASHATLPVALNASLTNVSSMANHCKQDLDTSDNLHINWLSSTCDDPMALYYDVEEAEISAAYHNNSEQVLMIDRHKAPLPWYPPIWAQVSSSSAYIKS